ncbi:hypothetical protein H0H87_006748 [Tephrocybe sp. NHM501043]|nr:hypothetical protein H0H87_006748 [Tephrocybe sp. NHM501043]
MIQWLTMSNKINIRHWQSAVWDQVKEDHHYLKASELDKKLALLTSLTDKLSSTSHVGWDTALLKNKPKGVAAHAAPASTGGKHFLSCYLQVAAALPGTKVAVFDVDATFCNIPTCPEDWHLLAMVIEGLIYLNMWLNFGGTASPGVFGHIAYALICIFLVYGIDAILR